MQAQWLQRRYANLQCWVLEQSVFVLACCSEIKQRQQEGPCTHPQLLMGNTRNSCAVNLLITVTAV